MLAGVDGSAGWQAARVLLVVVVTALAVWFTRRPGAPAGARRLSHSGSRAPRRARVRSARIWRKRLDAAAAAVVVLVTGVVLLAWGAATLIRAIPGWWRLLAVPTAMAVLWFVLLPPRRGSRPSSSALPTSWPRST